jgi:hypothetical protein
MLAQSRHDGFDAALTQNRHAKNADDHSQHQQEDEWSQQKERQSSGPARQGRVRYLSPNLGAGITLQLAAYQAHVAMNHSPGSQAQVAAHHYSVTLHRPIHLHAATHRHQVAAGAARYVDGTTDTDGVTHRLVRADINGFANPYHVTAVLGRAEERSGEEQTA